jgi:hypothetical protein
MYDALSIPLRQREEIKSHQRQKENKKKRKEKEKKRKEKKNTRGGPL